MGAAAGQGSSRRAMLAAGSGNQARYRESPTGVRKTAAAATTSAYLRAGHPLGVSRVSMPECHSQFQTATPELSPR
jgi:hypothetical protein